MLTSHQGSLIPTNSLFETFIIRTSVKKGFRTLLCLRVNPISLTELLLGLRTTTTKTTSASRQSIIADLESNDTYKRLLPILLLFLQPLQPLPLQQQQQQQPPWPLLHKHVYVRCMVALPSLVPYSVAIIAAVARVFFFFFVSGDAQGARARAG